MVAAATGNTEAVRQLIAKGAKVDLAGSVSATAAHSAIPPSAFLERPPSLTLGVDLSYRHWYWYWYW